MAVTGHQDISYGDAIHVLGDWEGALVDVALRGDQSRDPHPLLLVAGELGPLVMDNDAARVEVRTGPGATATSFTGFWLSPAWVSGAEVLTAGDAAILLRIGFDNDTVLSVSPA
jgi:hypothetical protein